MTRPMSEEREKAFEAARRLLRPLPVVFGSKGFMQDDKDIELVARALLSTSDDLAKANECWRKSRQYNDTLRRELDVARAAERGLREALEAMRARDDRNGSLPEWYREQIDAALSGIEPGEDEQATRASGPTAPTDRL